MGQSLIFDKCIPTLEVSGLLIWVCFGVFFQIVLQAFMYMVCHCLLSPPWWISNLNVKPSAELESYCLDCHQCKEVLWARLMPYNTYENCPEIVTLTLLGNSPPLLACRTSSNACKTCVAKYFILLGELRKGSEGWKLIRELQWSRRFVMETRNHIDAVNENPTTWLQFQAEAYWISALEKRLVPFISQWIYKFSVETMSQAFKHQEVEIRIVFSNMSSKIFILMERENCYNTVKAVIFLKNRIDIPKYPLVCE